MKQLLLKLKIYLHKFIFGYEHDWTNDFYMLFYDKDGNSLPQDKLNNIWADVTDSKITSGQNPNNNNPAAAMHSDKGYLHNLWVVGHKGKSYVADWFNNKISGGHGAAIGIRSDYDQKTETGLPEDMNFAVSNELYFTINGQNYYTNYVWGMVGADIWKVFKHAVKDVAKDIFKDSVMEELEVPEQIAETVSTMDKVNDTGEILSAMENNYYFGVVNQHTDVRKINWGEKKKYDQSAIITPLVRVSDNQVSDYYVIFKSCDCSLKESSAGNGLNVINVYCVNF